MTIAADKTKEIYTGNDVTTVFPYPFKIFQSTDLVVILTDTTVSPNTETILTAGVDYTVSGVGDEAGGNVTYPVSGDPLATGEKLTVWRVPAILQGIDFQNQGGFYAQTHEDALDLLTMICQYVSEFVQRAFALAVSDQSGASLTIPNPEASTVIGWNSSADALENISPGSITLATPASDSIIASMINAAGTQATLTKLLSGNTAIWQKGADVASAAVLPLLSDGNYNHVTGVAAVTSVATVGKGTLRILKFTGILVWTHHATDLINIGGADITTAAGDHAIILEYDTGKWVMIDYIRASSLPMILDTAQTVTGDKTFSGVNTFTNDIIASGGVQTDGANTLKTKVLDIGAWDMDTTVQVNVAHGLTQGDIRSITGLIRKDDNASLYPLSGYAESAAEVAVNIATIGSANVVLSRVAASFFDGVNFDLTSYTLDNAAAVDKGSGLVGIPITAHTFNAKDNTTLAGTTNYDGTYTIVSQTANEIVIEATYVAETFAGTETASWSRGWLAITYIV